MIPLFLSVGTFCPQSTQLQTCRHNKICCKNTALLLYSKIFFGVIQTKYYTTHPLHTKSHNPTVIPIPCLRGKQTIYPRPLSTSPQTPSSSLSPCVGKLYIFRRKQSSHIRIDPTKKKHQIMQKQAHRGPQSTSSFSSPFHLFM